MKRFVIAGLLLVIVFSFSTCRRGQPEDSVNQQTDEKVEYAIVIHGGAGNTQPADLSETERALYTTKLEEALNKGRSILSEGGTSLDAVEQVINILEDSPLFNAGKGAVFTHHGTNEMDASIMDGATLNAGAVAGVRDVKNPITAARAVMEKSKHVMLASAGASQFAREQNLQIVDTSYFFTEKRWKALQKQLRDKNGTVGCVALDQHGNLAAGTSTGGMTNKKYGRIGDSPIIGAGTYARNQTCAVSATGHGEYFIRYTVAHDISALMEYQGLTLQEAADRVIHQKLKKENANGGIIAVDHKGNISATFNTTMMFRAFAKSTGEQSVAIFE